MAAGLDLVERLSPSGLSSHAPSEHRHTRSRPLNVHRFDQSTQKKGKEEGVQLGTVERREQ